MPKVTDNRTFWKTVVPLFSNKFSKSEKINLTEGNKTISNDDEIPNISNYKLDNANDPLKKALKYFENHPSIANIKSKSFDARFTFRDTSSSEVIKLIKTRNVRKASQKSDIPTKIIKLNADFFRNFIYKNFNYCLKKGEFSCALKHADVILVHKNETKSDKANYRPVSIFPNLSKIDEKLMYQQLYKHFNSILSPKQCGFRKGYTVQHRLMVMLETFKESRDKGGEFGAFFTDLSKAFDCIDPNLLILSYPGMG